MRVVGGGERFRRAQRLRSAKDFRRVSREGTRVAAPSFVVLIAAQRADGPRQAARLGITVSRRVGPAVIRSRIKRCVREWFRRADGLVPSGKDLVVIARPSAGRASQTVLARDLAAALRELVRRLGGA